MPDITVKTLYFDEHIRVIHKPENISFHTDDHAEGIVSRVKSAYPQELLFPVHRLDKMTSGLLVFARSQQVNSLLSQKLADKKVEKYYLALSRQKPRKKQGSIIGDMQKGRRGSYLLLRENKHPAITRFFARSLIAGNERRWFFVLKPETGKTHQLRVALKSISSPVLGDARYENMCDQTHVDRGYLHAYKMRFDLFDKRYELCDPDFSGDMFSLNNPDTQLALSELLTPEKLTWPKGAFRMVSKG